MKKIKFLWTLLVIAALFNATADAAAGDISPSIDILRSQVSMTKCVITGQNVSFTSDEFTDIVGSEFKYITVTELPQVGALKLAGINVIKGQTISAGNLNHLEFVPAENSVGEMAFIFTVSAQGWANTAIKCSMNVLPTVNYAPVTEDFEINTVAGVAAYQQLKVYDPENDDMTIIIEQYPKWGKLEVDSKTKTVVYTPSDGFTGVDAFVYSAADKYGHKSSLANASVAVSGSGIYFADMIDNKLHYAALKMANDNIMTYTLKAGEYYFSPDEEVNRIDFTVMLMCAAKLDDGVKYVSNTVFTDDTTLSYGRKAYLSHALDIGVVRDVERTFKPYGTISGSYAAEIVQRALGVDEAALAEIMGDNADKSGLTKADAAEILYNIVVR